MTADTDQITVENFTTLWNFNEPAATEERFRELLPVAKEDMRFHIELLTQIARTYGLRGEFYHAHQLLDEAEILLNVYSPEESARPRIRYLLERGRTWNSSGKPELSRPLFLDAWEIGKQRGEDRLAIDAAHMMGIIEPQEESIRWNLEALKFAEGSSDESARLWLGSLYNNLGVTYLEAEEYEKALEYYRRGLDWHTERQSPKGPLRIARWCVARAQRSCGQVEEALAEQRELERLADEDGEKSGYVYEEIAECLLALDRPEDASPYFRAAYEELSNDDYLVRNESERLERLRTLGNS